MKAPKKYIGRGVALDRETFEEVDKRIQTMRPWVSSFSDYIRRLIYADLEIGVLNEGGAINDEALKRLPKIALVPIS